MLSASLISVKLFLLLYFRFCTWIMLILVLVRSPCLFLVLVFGKAQWLGIMQILIRNLLAVMGITHFLTFLVHVFLRYHVFSDLLILHFVCFLLFLIFSTLQQNILFYRILGSLAIPPLFHSVMISKRSSILLLAAHSLKSWRWIFANSFKIIVSILAYPLIWMSIPLMPCQIIWKVVFANCWLMLTLLTPDHNSWF